MSEQLPQNPQANPEQPASETTMTFASISALEGAFTVAGTSPEVRDAVSALPLGSALLVVRAAGVDGERFLLDRDRLFAGRSERADIFLNDVTVSRKHVEFIRHGSEFEVRDQGSLNGTYINRDRIDSYILKTGDEIQIGKYRMVYYQSPLAQVSPQSASSADE
ncbi:FHA domain-containing protein [Timonella senegalensis]|uniref:FHA domain-containing protein n=1 Tax=Timonella senegalensis TaxID=1465825 RepID=UPI002FDCC1BC